MGQERDAGGYSGPAARGGVEMKFMIVTMFVAVFASTSCAGTSPTQPTSPNFAVVSTDWRQALVAPQQHDHCVSVDANSGQCISWIDRGAIYEYTAHGVFRNQGAAGSASVTFADGQGQSCRTVVNAQAGQLVEASCPMGEHVVSTSPPSAQVSG
jgi:hypothetical protein